MSDVLTFVNIPTWTGEIETTNRTPVKLRQPATLRLLWEDCELAWDQTIDLGCAFHDAAAIALYKAQSARRVHERLNKLRIKTEAGVYVPLDELGKQITEAQDALQPPFVGFERVYVDRLGDKFSQPGRGTTESLRVVLTSSGASRRFANLCLARIKHGFDIYGRRPAAIAA